jgi:photosystem II stability/assembly factor-like uncharacterized protein
MTGASTEISALAVSASNPQVLYAARRVRYELGIMGVIIKTTNGGASFTNVTSNLPDSLYYTAIEVNETNPNIAYLSMAGFSNGNKVYMTTNGGASWQNISYNLPNIPVNSIKQIPATNHLMVATDIGVYILNSGSTAWMNNSFGLPNVIVSDIEFNTALNKVYVSTFGRGIWESSYSAVTSIAENKEFLSSFELFPSVNKGDFTLQFTDDHEKLIEVIDIMGKVVYSQNAKSEKIQMKLNLSSGAYYTRVTGDNKIGVKKFIVE